MRWKLLIIASLIAAVAGAAGSLSLLNFLPYLREGSLQFATELALVEIFPLAMSCLVGVFVYRHTARRRKTQAVIVVMLSLCLFHALVYAFLKLPPIVLND